jgi:hypothetical protein
MVSSAPSSLRLLAVGVPLFAAIWLLSAGAAAADTRPPGPQTPSTVSADPLPTVQINGVAWDQVIVGERVYVTGEFTQARPAGAAVGTNETPRNNILAYDLRTGTLITDWAPALNAQGFVITASPDGSRIYVGGDFTQANGVTRNRLVALDARTGAVVTDFTVNVNHRVYDIEVTADRLYLGGSFTAVGNQARSRLAAVSSATGTLLDWAPVADAEVRTLVAPAGFGNVVAGGRFTTLNGADAYGMGAVDAVTGATLPWAANRTIRNAGPNATMAHLTADGGTVYGTGWQFGGQGPGGNFEGLFAAHAGTGEIAWIQGCRGDTYQFTHIGDLLYSVSHAHDCGMVRGHPEGKDTPGGRKFQYAQAFTTYPAADGRRNTYLDFAGWPASELLHWLPTFSQGSYTGTFQATWTVASNDQYVVIGGEFPRVNGTHQQGLVRFAVTQVAPNTAGPQGRPELQPVLTEVGPGTIRIAWTAAWDRDNERLTHEVLRGGTVATSTVIATKTVDTNWWTRPPMGFIDATATPGSQQTYRLRVTDPFGNVVTSSLTTITIPSGTPVASPYRDAVRSDGALHHWRFGEPSGTTARDWAYSSDLTLDTSVARGTAGALLNEADAASTFSATADATVPATTAYRLHGPQTFSVEAWIRTTTTTGGRILGFGSSATDTSSVDGNDRHLYMSDNGALLFGLRPGSQPIAIASPSGFNDGKWHHVVGTLGQTGMRLYVDGTLVGSRSDVTKAQDRMGYWRVGGDTLANWPGAPTNSRFGGAIDEVAVYPGALTAEQVQAHYRASGREIVVPDETVFAQDTFSRTVAAGLGTADVGGAWTLRGAAENFSVSDGVGRIRGDVAGASRAGFLESVKETDAGVTVALALDTQATTGDSYVSVIGRRVSNGNDYRLKLRFFPTGAVSAHLVRVAGFAETDLGVVTVPGLTYRSGEVLRLRFQVSGTTTTTLNAKVWRAGTTEPTDWLITRTDATPTVLQAPGGLGVLLYLSGSINRLPVTLTIDDYHAGRLAQ